MPKAITSDYDSHTKEELLGEIEARKIEGVPASALKADIVSALEKDDAGGDKPPTPMTPAAIASPQPRQPMPGNIPVVKSALPANIPRAPGALPDLKDYKGEYTKDDGEVYALATVPEDQAIDHKTHFAMNTEHFWNGTQQQFKEQFEKK